MTADMCEVLRWFTASTLALTLAVPTSVSAAPGQAPAAAGAAGAPGTAGAAGAAGAAHDASADAAYQSGLRLIAAGQYEEAIGQLDLASELEPTWSAPVRARADAFAVLADRYHPSEAFSSARAADLQRLLALEPGVDTAARQQEIASLQKRSTAASKAEQRRRKLATPALIVIITSGTLIISGAMLYAMKPNEFLQPSAYRHEQRTRAGLIMLVTGVAMVPAAITLGVLSGRQVRRDSAVQSFNVETGRPRLAVGVAPQVLHGGGGAGLSLRF